MTEDMELCITFAATIGLSTVEKEFMTIHPFPHRVVSTNMVFTQLAKVVKPLSTR